MNGSFGRERFGEVEVDGNRILTGPFDVGDPVLLAGFERAERRMDDAIVALRASIDSRPEFAQAHYVLGMAVTMGAFSGIYYWYPKITGRMFPEVLGQASFWLIWLGSNILYFSMMVMGIDGMPRRYVDYPDVSWWALLSQAATGGAVIMFVGEI